MSTTQDQLAIASLLSGHLAAARASLTAAIAERLRDQQLDIRPREFAFLHLLASAEGCAPAEVAEYTSTSATAMRQAMAKLADAGWVEAEAHEEDKRFRTWRATAKGRECVERVLASAPEPALRVALEALSAEQRELLDTQATAVLHALHPGGSCAQAHARLSRQFSRACRESGTFGDQIAIWFQFTRLYRSMRDEQMRFLASATDNLLDSAAYMALYRAGERHCILGDVATFLRVDQNTAVRVVDRLESAKLVERRRNPANRRQLLICPTAKGRALLAEVPPLDRNGSYFKAIRALPERGKQLAEALQRFTTGYLQTPVVDSDKLYSIFTEVQQRAEQSASPLPGTDFRRAMSNFLTGVAVVTVAGEDGPRGVTVNSLTSVSLDPPILLICFDRRSSALRRVQDIGAFGVNILASDQKPLAQRFAKPGGAEPFEPVESRHWIELGGVPLLADSLVRMTCELEQTFEAGTHTVVFGRPKDVQMTPGRDGSALGYWRSDYLDVHRPLTEPAK